MPVRLSPVSAALVLSGGAGGAQLVVQPGPHIDGPVGYDWSFIMNSRAEVGAARERSATERRDGAA